MENTALIVAAGIFVLINTDLISIKDVNYIFDLTKNTSEQFADVCKKRNIELLNIN